MSNRLTIQRVDAMQEFSAPPVLTDAALLASQSEELDSLAREALNVAHGDGRMRLRGHGALTLGAIDLHDHGDLETAARQAYAAIFAALAGRPDHRLLRLWNYIPRIHDEEDGLERYRRFNIGRQRAFLDAGASAFAGAPAACALGRGDGPLSIRFAAGPFEVRALENPRQIPAWRYDSRYGPSSPTFSRALLAEDDAGRRALFISGTASIVGQETVHEADLHAQTRETCTNLRAVCAAAQQPFACPTLRWTVYLRDPADRAEVERILEQEGVRPAAWLKADICRRDLLLEIEGHAFPGPD